MLVLKILGVLAVILGGFMCNLLFQDEIKKRFQYELNGTGNIILMIASATSFLLAIVWADYSPEMDTKYFTEDLMANSNVMALTLISISFFLTVIYRNFTRTNIMYGVITSIYHSAIIVAFQIGIATSIGLLIVAVMGLILVAGTVFS